MAYRLITPPPRKPSKQPPKEQKVKVEKVKKPRKFRGVAWSIVLIVIVGILVVGTMSYLQPLPQLKPTIQRLTPPTASDIPLKLPWPNYGQAAIGTQGYGVLATNGQQTAAPTASMAKVITALCVLSKKPLSLGAQGPDIRLTDADKAIYDSYFAKDGSIIAIQAGESISEYQALEAMLLPSADNMADSLANWAFGSVSNYVKYANNYLKPLGLKQTKVADASGFSPQTVSSAHDLVLIGIKALKNPLLAAIFNEQSANIPVAGTIYNRNWLLGTDGVIGIKTGNTDQAGGCFLFAANRTISGQTVTVVGAVMGAPSYSSAVRDSEPLITASDSGFAFKKVVSAGQIVGQYQAPWGAKANVMASRDLSLLVWKTASPATQVKLNVLKAPQSENSYVGTISVVSAGQVKTEPAILAQPLPAPSKLWRFFH